MYKRTALFLILFCGTLFSAPEWHDPDFFRDRGSEVDSFLSKSFKRVEYAREKMLDYWKRARKTSEQKTKSAVKTIEKKASDTVQKLPEKLK